MRKGRLTVLCVLVLLAGCETCNQYQGACAVAAVCVGVAAGIVASNHKNRCAVPPCQ